MKKIKSDYPKLIALILGIILVIVGIIFMIKSQNYNYNGGVSRATTIEFGADFYPTEEYIGLTANAVCDLYMMVTMGIGVFFVFVGGTDICIISSKLKNKMEK